MNYNLLDKWIIRLMKKLQASNKKNEKSTHDVLR